MAGMSRGPDQNEPPVDTAGPGGDVHRRTPLPLAPARGHLIVPEAVVATTLTTLRGFH